MTKLRSRLFGLPALALAAAGALCGQALCPSPVQPANPAGNLLRIEGTTEEVADANVYCAAGSTVSTGTLIAVINAQVTSPKVGAVTDAAVLITPTDGAVPTPSPTGPPVAYLGTILPDNQGVAFSNVSFPVGAFSISVRNLRIDATLLPIGYSVNETIQVIQGGLNYFDSSPQVVGIVLQGFGLATVSGVNNYLVCQGSGPANPTPAGNITITELFGGAFKSQTPAGANGTQVCGAGACASTNGEQGTYAPGGAVGMATHGTRFQLAFANLNPAITLSVPLSVTSGELTMLLTANATGPFVAPASGALITTAAGTAVAWYEVTQTDNTQPPESISIPVTANAPPNFAQADVPPFTVVVTVAPQNSTDIPNFSPAAQAPLALSAYNFCQSPQTITLAPVSNMTFGATPFALTAIASSGLPVTFRSDTPGVCAVSGVTVTIVTAGACTITADQLGNVNFFPAQSVTDGFVVSKAPQTITFGSLSNQVSGAPPFALTAVASSGLPVTFSSTTSTVCTITGVTVTLLSAGTCTVAANQSGNANYFAATSVTQSFTFSPGVQPLTLQCAPTTGPTQSGIPYSASCATAGGKTPYTFSIGTGALPPGLAVNPNTGAIAGTPNAGGAYSYSIQVEDNESPLQSASQSYAGKIASPVAVTPALLSFVYRIDETAAPAPQTVSVFSAPPGLGFTAAVSSGNWLSIQLPVSVDTPGTLTVAINPTGLMTAGPLNGAITITPTGGAVPVTVPVTLLVLPQSGPQLSATPSAETFTLTKGSSTAGQITVSNTGGGTLQFSAVSDQPGWLATESNGSATFATPGTLGFSVSTAGLNPGLNTGHITIAGANASGNAEVTISVVVSASSDSIQLSKTSLIFTADTGGPLPPGQTIIVTEPAQSWTAQVQTITGGDWLQVTSAGAAATVSIIQTNLAPGEYYGSIAITAPTAANSPQTISVLLTVDPSGTEAGGIGFSTGGLILTGLAGGATVTGHVSVFNPSVTPGTYSVTTVVSEGSGWLSVSPGQTLAPGSNDLAIQANLAGLSPGVYNGTVTAAFNDGSTRVIEVALLAKSGATSACGGFLSSYLIPRFAQPLSQSTLQVAVPQQVQVQIVDNCGNPVTQQNGGLAQVTFSNGDPALNLTDAGGGLWEGTWTPASAAALTILQVVAQQPRVADIPSGAANRSVGVTATSASGAALPQGVVNAASGSTGTPQIVTPGSFVAIYGILLASGGGTSATTVPLPINLGDAKLLLGGQSLPLSYTSAGQVNALIPQNLNPNASYSLVVQRGTTQSAPLPVTLVGLQPGIYTVNRSGTGQGIVQIAGTSLMAAPTADGSRPVQSGTELLTIYATGLGPVIGTKGEPAPLDGAAATLPAIYQTQATLTATLGGVSVPVTFSGLTPTLVALYQVNVQVPAGVPTGNAIPLVITATGADGSSAQSNTVSIAVQ
jgi:uncharacterized protein (TIGR03437 family)